MSGYIVGKWRYPYYNLQVAPGNIYQLHWDLVDGDLGRIFNVTAFPGTNNLFGTWSVFTQHSLGQEKIRLPSGSADYKGHLWADFKNSGGQVMRDLFVFLWHTEDYVASLSAVADKPARMRTAVEHDAEGNIRWACMFEEGSPVPSASTSERFVALMDAPIAGFSQDKEMEILADLVENHRIDPATGSKAALIRK